MCVCVCVCIYCCNGLSFFNYIYMYVYMDVCIAVNKQGRFTLRPQAHCKYRLHYYASRRVRKSGSADQLLLYTVSTATRSAQDDNYGRQKDSKLSLNC